MRRLVGICGRKRHGKDTAAEALVGRGYSKLSLADPLRELLLKLNPYVACRQGPDGITSDARYPVTWLNRLAKLVEVYGWEGAKESDDVRRHMQKLGHTCRDMFGQDFWIMRLNDRIKDLESFASIMGTPLPSVVVSDVRYKDEGDYIKSNGGLLIWVFNPVVEECSDRDAHPSEALEVSSMADVKVENVGTVEDLHRKVLESCGIIEPTLAEALH